MTYRDEREALRARVAVLEAQTQELADELARTRASQRRETWRKRRRWAGYAGVVVAALGAIGLVSIALLSKGRPDDRGASAVTAPVASSAASVWDGSGTLTCSEGTVTARGLRIRRTRAELQATGSRSLVTAHGSCRIELVDCDIEAPWVVAAQERARVVLRGGRIQAEQYAIYLFHEATAEVHGTEVVGEVGGELARVTGLGAAAPWSAPRRLAHQFGIAAKCVGVVDGFLVGARASYLAAVGDEPGSAKSPIVVLDELPVERCLAELAEAAGTPPTPPGLERALTAYRATLADLAPVYGKVRDYYRHADYRDDAYALGKQFHAPLLEAIDRSREAASALRARLAEQRPVVDRWIADPNATPGRRALALLLAAYDVAVALASESPPGSGLVAAVEQFVAIRESMQKLMTEQAEKRAEAAAASAWLDLDHSAGSTLTAAKLLRRRVVDREPLREQDVRSFSSALANLHYYASTAAQGE